MSNTALNAALRASSFKKHKTINKFSKTQCWSAFHPTERNVRILVDTGIKASGNQTTQAKVKAVFINNANQWRNIVPEQACKPADITKAISDVQTKAAKVPVCKFCYSKKFVAKSGKTVCASACWTNRNNGGNNNMKKSTKWHRKVPKVTKMPKPAKATKPSSTPTYALIQIKPGDMVQLAKYDSSCNITYIHKGFLGTVSKVESQIKLGDNIDVFWMKKDYETVPTWAMPYSNRIDRSGDRYCYHVISRDDVEIKNK